MIYLYAWHHGLCKIDEKSSKSMTSYRGKHCTRRLRLGNGLRRQLNSTHYTYILQRKGFNLDSIWSMGQSVMWIHQHLFQEWNKHEFRSKFLEFQIQDTFNFYNVEFNDPSLSCIIGDFNIPPHLKFFNVDLIRWSLSLQEIFVSQFITCILQNYINIESKNINYKYKGMTLSLDNFHVA